MLIFKENYNIYKISVYKFKKIEYNIYNIN